MVKQHNMPQETVNWGELNIAYQKRDHSTKMEHIQHTEKRRPTKKICNVAYPRTDDQQRRYAT